MRQTICEYCGANVEYRYESQKPRFCSHLCANRFNKLGKKTAKMVEYTCASCGKKFEVKASDYRVKNGAVKYCSKECGYIGSRTGSILKCKQCGKEFYTTRNEFCSPHCASEYRHDHANGKTYFENGYIVHHVRGYNKRGNAKEHRLVAEEMMGRPLKADEVVHHINGDRADNRKENLRVMTRGEHSRLHREMEIKSGRLLFGRGQQADIREV